VDKAVQEKKQIKERKVLREAAGWVGPFCAIFVFGVIIMHTIVLHAGVTSGSMESTIMTNDMVLGLRTAYWFSEPQRFDVIVFDDPNAETPGLIREMVINAINRFRCEQNRIAVPELIVKRVIGLPGEMVEIRGGYVYINGMLLEDDVFARGFGERRGYFPPTVIPEGHFFVMGDNRNNSLDSRQTGMLAREYIRARVHFIIQPSFSTVR